MAITALPTPPSRSDPVNFANEADAFLGALPLFQTEANDLQTDVNAKQVSTVTYSNYAQAAANAAAVSASSSVWISGTTYAIGDVRFSPLNFYNYRRKIAGAGTTDPSTDTTNWSMISFAGVAGTTVTGGGSGALQSNTTGVANTAFGANALSSSANASYNTAVGYQALFGNTSGYEGTAVGYRALWANSQAQSNTAVGAFALTACTGVGPIQNTAVGHSTLMANTAGFNNAAIGFNALKANTSGNSNTSIGAWSSAALTTGTSNTAIGYGSSQSLLTGLTNTAIGRQSLFGCQSGSYNTAIGGSSLQDATASGNIGIGGITAAGLVAPVFNITTQSNYASFGTTAVTNAYIQVAWTVVSDARDKTDFAEVPHGLDFVSKLQPTAYRYKLDREATEGHGPVRYGFKAQDILALEGDNSVIVDADNPDKLYFNEQSLVAVLVNAIKELKLEVDALKSKVNALELK
jgi:hypothetical protein